MGKSPEEKYFEVTLKKSVKEKTVPLGDSLKKNKLYPKLERYCKMMVDEIDDLATDYKIPHTINSIASMFQIFFTNQKVIDYKTAKKSRLRSK